MRASMPRKSSLRRSCSILRAAMAACSTLARHEAEPREMTQERKIQDVDPSGGPKRDPRDAPGLVHAIGPPRQVQGTSMQLRVASGAMVAARAIDSAQVRRSIRSGAGIVLACAASYQEPFAACA